jgi:hypothetical protein
MPSSKKSAIATKGKKKTDAFSRAELVGKFPHISHQPAPKAAKYLLSDEVRSQIVSRMKLR